jgi:hypothetical protein
MIPKNKSITPLNDIRVNRKVVTRITQVNPNNPYVVEINVSMCIIPKQEREKEEYKNQIARINRFCQKTLKEYITTHGEIFDTRKVIFDTNLSSVNLRKGYNKSVQMSLFVKQNKPDKLSKLSKRVKNTIGVSIQSIVDKIKTEDFKCFKRKQVVNKTLQG